MTEIDALAREMREGLDGVTPGKWKLAGALHVYLPGEHGANICSVGELRASTTVGYTPMELGSKDSDEAYRIALHLTRCSPDNIRALLDDRDRLIARVAELEMEVEQLKRPRNAWPHFHD